MAREHYFDFIRGLAIIMVVAIHCYPSHIRFSDGWIEICGIVLRNLMNCAVPLFLAISGYFIGRRVCANPDFSWKSFWSRQVPKVYVPCMVFSIPWLMLDLYSGVSPLKGIVMTLLCGMSVYYFILLILCCYLISPAMIRLRNRFLLSFTFVLAFVSIVGCFVWNTLGGNLPLIIQGSVLSFGFFFAIGIVLGREEWKYSIKWPLMIVLAGLVVSMAETYFWQVHYDVNGVGQKASALVFNTGVIFLCFCPGIRNAYKENRFQRAVRWLGDISFGIYFTHVLLIYLFRRLASDLMESWFMSTLLTLSATVIVIMVCKSVAPGFSKRYLGYR